MKLVHVGSLCLLIVLLAAPAALAKGDLIERKDGNFVAYNKPIKNGQPLREDYEESMTVVLLCYERRETRWWRKNVHPHAERVVSLYPRVKHLDPRTGEPAEGSPNVHSSLVIYRPGVSGPPANDSTGWKS